MAVVPMTGYVDTPADPNAVVLAHMIKEPPERESSTWPAGKPHM